MSRAVARVDYWSYAGLGLLSICFGSTFYFNYLAFSFFSALEIGAGRIVVAALCLVPLAVLSGTGLPSNPRVWRWSAIYGALQIAGPFYLLTYAQTVLPANIIGFYFSTIPILLLLLARIFLRATITRRKWGGFAVGFFGLTLLSGPGTYSQVEVGPALLPQLAVIVACLMFAGSGILIRFIPATPPLSITAAGSLIAAVASVPIVLVNLPESVPPTVPVVGILGVGVFSTALGLTLRFWLIRRRGPVFIASNPYLIAIVSGFLAVFLIGETITRETAIAFAVILCGLLIAQDGTGDMQRQ